MTIIKTVGLVGVAALALGACGGPTVEGGGGTPTTPAAGGDATTPGGETTEAGFDWSSVEPATEIAFWTNHPGGSMDIEKELVEKFTAETGITVDHVTAGANYAEVSQRFQTAQVSGDQGDVVVLSDANWFSAYLAGSIAPVSSPRNASRPRERDSRLRTRSSAVLSASETGVWSGFVST